MNDYLGRLNVPPIPDQLDGVGRLHAHTLGTDPERFVVACQTLEGAAGREAIVGFASAIERGPVWFLSMLFVAPEHQGRGLGRRLLRRVLPEGRDGGHGALCAVTDSVQPISNGLYAMHGIVPQLPLAHLVGRPSRAGSWQPLPAGISVSPLASGDQLPESIHALDRELLGFDHAVDHRFAGESGRQLQLVRDRDDALLGYGYISAAGNVGPVAVRHATLLAPVTAHLLGQIQPRGALAVWVPGAAGETVSSLIRAGLRIDGFPLLIGWSRAFADFERYLPQSPGLL
jgi:GNAT superfamily N-acetyltransferase